MTEHEIPRTVVATTPLREAPRWAILERELFRILDLAWREFERTYCAADGRLVYRGTMRGRDGVDDFYEPFFNWPTLYRLGGSDELLQAAKLHWEGVTVQMTEFGFVKDEFELGYDWFHQAESLNFFYALCAADPSDEKFRERAKRFARLYTDPANGNYDPATRTIVAPHTGSGGPRWGVGEDWEQYRADQVGMDIYGLPLMDLEGITTWDDLAVADNARRMGDAMQGRMGVGDTAINLAASSLATNAWLYDNAAEFEHWVREYVGAWRERAEANDGLLPDNVGPGGTVGELHDGRWFGGHYGWAWPHGLHSVEAAAMVAATNLSIITGDLDDLELARTPLTTVMAHGLVLDSVSTRGSLGWGWAQKMGVPETQELLLVPYRHGPDGWFDLHPVPLIYPAWLWWLSQAPADLERLVTLRENAGFDWRESKWFHDKEEQGHEAPWLAYLLGDNDSFPEDALELAIGQVLRRVALMRAAPHDPEDGDIHWWQRLNPVVTEALSYLTTGAPPAIYYGGLAPARVVFGDARQARPGLPDEVAALVSAVSEAEVVVEILNLSDSARQSLWVQAGAFAEDRILRVDYDSTGGEYPGDSHNYGIPHPSALPTSLEVDANRLLVHLPPRTRITLTLAIERRAYRARHATFPQTPKETA